MWGGFAEPAEKMHDTAKLYILKITNSTIAVCVRTTCDKKNYKEFSYSLKSWWGNWGFLKKWWGNWSASSLQVHRLLYEIVMMKTNYLLEYVTNPQPSLLISWHQSALHMDERLSKSSQLFFNSLHGKETIKHLNMRGKILLTSLADYIHEN